MVRTPVQGRTIPEIRILGNNKDHQSDQSGDADQTHDGKNPKTGDDMKLTVYFVLVLLSGTAAAVVIRRKAGAKREESR